MWEARWPRTTLIALLGLVACNGQNTSERAQASADPNVQAEQAASAEAAPEQDPYPEHPLHGLVTGTQLTVRRKPDPEAIVLGWLRHGEQVRLKSEPANKTQTCSSGWYEVHPRGYACAGEGIKLQPEPFDIAPELRSNADRTAALPYRYLFVKEHKVAEFHQLPSRDQQRAAVAYAKYWRGLEIADRERHEKRARGRDIPYKPGPALRRFKEGKDTRAPTRHAAIRRFLERGFYVASTGSEVRSRRTFARTVRGSYVKEAQVIPRQGPQFHGVELGEERTLPVAWAVRGAHPRIVRERDDGAIKLVKSPNHEPIERLSLLENYKDRVRVGGQWVHELDDGSYLRDWFAAVARPMERPKGVGKDEPWVHVDLGQQTLVLYRGDTPAYATLVSTGLDGHNTPVGEFRIQRKHITDTMSDIGADAADDRYSIEDVPWTQYFKGSLALHGAFWHERFGMQRSHGCVNLSPIDAQYIFARTWPAVPEGWHGASTFKSGQKSSLVVVTE